MKKTIDFIQKESFKIYKKKYSKEYIEKNLLPIINYILISKKTNFLFSGSQGIGKTTLIKIISNTLSKVYGKTILSLSLDDYYLSKSSRINLAKKQHNLLITRGVPGTHKIKKLISDIKKHNKSIFPIETPIFDKLIDDSIKKKKIVRKKSDILILEGWCCGCSEINKSYLNKNINQLEKEFDKNYYWRKFYNNQLKNDYKKLFNLFDEKIYIKAPSFKYVINWRLKQEKRNLSNSKKLKRMNINEIKIFIQHYEKITRWMISKYSKSADLVINVDKNQKIVSLKSNKRKPIF